jgi:S1-C subfamily serine protease
MRLRVRKGLLVAGVDPESPAAAAGFQSGDVVVMIDRYPIADLATLGHLLAQVDRGDRILFVVVRGRTSARVVLEARVGGEDDAEAEAEAADAPAGGGATEGAPAEDAAGRRSRADE